MVVVLINISYLLLSVKKKLGKKKRFLTLKIMFLAINNTIKMISEYSSLFDKDDVSAYALKKEGILWG